MVLELGVALVLELPAEDMELVVVVLLIALHTELAWAAAVVEVALELWLLLEHFQDK